MLPVFGAPSTNIRTLEPRILYVQYANPAELPPLEHSSRILADKGWNVLFLGIDGTEGLTFDPHPRIRLKRMEYCKPGFLQKLQYLQYCAWVLWTIAIWRPTLPVCIRHSRRAARMGCNIFSIAACDLPRARLSAAIGRTAYETARRISRPSL